jgi:predicted MFS family arabinose efflux permease
VWVLGVIGIAATIGWLCGNFLALPRPKRRTVFVVLGTLIAISVIFFAAFNAVAALAFVSFALLFSCLHAAWRLRIKTQRIRKA